MIQKLKSEFRALRYSLYHRLAFSPDSEQKLIEGFHKLYYDSAIFRKTWYATHWLGARVSKCPLDLWNYQELLYQLQPDLIIETGTLFGGSAYFYATVCDWIGKGQVVTINIEDASATLARERHPPEKVRPAHPRIQYWQGSSISQEIIKRLEPLVAPAKSVFVTLDSDHRKEHVLAELRLYSRFVTKGSYLIVEDTDINGHPVFPEYGPGPWEALDEFLQDNHDFMPDQEINSKHLLSLHPRGYLKRIR